MCRHNETSTLLHMFSRPRQVLLLCVGHCVSAALSSLSVLYVFFRVIMVPKAQQEACNIAKAARAERNEAKAAKKVRIRELRGQVIEIFHKPDGSEDVLPRQEALKTPRTVGRSRRAARCLRRALRGQGRAARSGERALGGGQVEHKTEFVAKMEDSPLCHHDSHSSPQQGQFTTLWTICHGMPLKFALLGPACGMVMNVWTRWVQVVGEVSWEACSYVSC